MSKGFNELNTQKILIGTILIIAIMGGFIFFLSQQTKPIEQNTPSIDLKASIEPKITEVGLRRQNYDLNAIVFSDLPAPPTDFYARKEQFEFKGLDLRLLDERYWKQPEFYPGFEKGGVPLLKSYPKDAIIRTGYGTYPSEGIVTLPANQEGTVVVVFFVHASWGVVTYQGFGTNIVYPTSGILQKSYFSDGKRETEQNPQTIQNAIISHSIAPNEFILSPSWSFWDTKLTDGEPEFERQEPKFDANWVKKITATFKIGKLPPGRYVIGINLTPPSEENRNQGLWEYSNLYEPSGSFDIGMPWYTLFLEVK